MSLNDKEAIASLRVLVCVAKADGVLHDEEKKALTAAVEGASLPGGTTLEALLSEKGDLAAQLAALESPEAREQTYHSAYAMAWADGECSPAEDKMLETIREKLGISAEKKGLLQRVFRETKDTVLLSNIEPVKDAKKRDAEIREDTLKYSVLSAVLGAFPVPGLAIATDLAVVALQVKLVRDIGQYWGHKVDRQGAKSILYGLGLGTGARMAVNNLAKLIPGWGSAVGAATSFASTWALGKVMNRFFADGKTAADAATLRGAFKEAEKEGKTAFRDQKDAIVAKERENRDALEALNEKLKAGEIDQAEFEKRAAELA